MLSDGYLLRVAAVQREQGVAFLDPELDDLIST
jgi:hypothetical protein